MEFPVDFLEPRIGNVRVYLGRRNGSMSQEFLNGADIRSIFQEGRSKAMAERMRGNVFGNTGDEGSPPYHFRDEKPGKPHGFVGQANRFDIVRIVIVPNEQRGERVAPRFEIGGYRVHGFPGKIYRTDLSSLSPDAEFVRFQVDAFAIEIREFGYSESRRIDAFQYGIIAPVLQLFAHFCAFEQPGYFFLIQKSYLSVMSLDEIDHGRVDTIDSFFLEVLEKRAKCYHVRVRRTDRESFVRQIESKLI